MVVPNLDSDHFDSHFPVREPVPAPPANMPPAAALPARERP
jgi:hypothetical protein